MEEIKETIINEPYGFIYITTNMVNGMKYLGQKKFDRIWKNYLGSGAVLRKAIDKYGKENFDRNIVCICNSPEELNRAEYDLSVFLDVVENPNWYNLCYGGGATNGYKRSDEEKAKLSRIIKEKMNTPEVKAKMENFYKNRDISGENNPNYGNHKLAGENNPNWGKKTSDETRAKIGDANRGKIWSEERRRTFSEKMKGRTGNPCSEETREKISLANKGRVLTQEQKDNLSARFSGENNPNYGKHWSEKMKRQIGDKLRGENSPNYGKHPSEETRQKMRENNANNRAVMQFDMSGSLIMEYNSLADMERATGISYNCVSIACTNHSSAGGYLWRYKDEYDPNIPIVYVNNNLKAVVQLCLDNGEFIAEYESGREAHRITGIQHQNIGRCCRGKAKHAGGFDWWYKTEYDEEFTKQK